MCEYIAPATRLRGIRLLGRQGGGFGCTKRGRKLVQPRVRAGEGVSVMIDVQTSSAVNLRNASLVGESS